MKFAKRTID